MDQVDIVIIGAGIVGLSIAAEVADRERQVYVIERHDAFGREISSRNSEVVHAGIYYPTGSLKAKTCVEGNRLLYKICAKYNIPCRKTGKFIIAIDKEEEPMLSVLLKQGLDNGVGDLEMFSAAQLKKTEPNVKAIAALYSSSTGIIDSHRLMEYFVQEIKECAGSIAYNSEVEALRKVSAGYEVVINENNGEKFQFRSKVVINCAGLNADKIAAMAGIDIKKEKYELKYCKGQYFRLRNPRKANLINHLIYPVPEYMKGGLGIHATLDLWGGLRLGPDSRYVSRDKFDYEVDLSEKKNFTDSLNRMIPFFEEEDFVPDTAGVRPKLQGPKESFRDFVIKEESDLGLPGLINLIGIESPGLTAAPAIAACVEKLVAKII